MPKTDLDNALDEAAAAIRTIREKHGNDALGLYIGNPVAHNLGLVIYGGIFALTLPSRNMGTAGSRRQDQAWSSLAEAPWASARFREARLLAARTSS